MSRDLAAMGRELAGSWLTVYTLGVVDGLRVQLPAISVIYAAELHLGAHLDRSPQSWRLRLGGVSARVEAGDDADARVLDAWRTAAQSRLSKRSQS